MRRVTRNGVIAIAAVSGAMAVTSPAFADSAADGGAAGSPGLIAGNTVRLPVHVPVNVCGNTVNVVGVLNPAAGNTCVNEGRGSEQTAPPAGAAAQSGQTDSPGVISGNDVQLPVHLPVNVSGNSVGVVGVGNAAAGNESTNTSGDQPAHPASPAPNPAPGRSRPAARPVSHPAPHQMASLAHTGADQTLPAVAASAAFVLAGSVLYRRFRPAPPR